MGFIPAQTGAWSQFEVLKTKLVAMTLGFSNAARANWSRGQPFKYNKYCR